MIFLQLFYTFFKIGLFSFGGGYGMLSVIQGEVVTKYGWLTHTEFTDIVAVSQMTPGPIGINSATYVGFTAVANAGYSEVWAILGSCLASFSVMLPRSSSCSSSASSSCAIASTPRLRWSSASYAPSS